MRLLVSSRDLSGSAGRGVASASSLVIPRQGSSNLFIVMFDNDLISNDSDTRKHVVFNIVLPHANINRFSVYKTNYRGGLVASNENMLFVRENKNASIQFRIIIAIRRSS